MFLAGLKRLRERGDFDIPLSVRVTTSSFQRDSDHVALFLEDCTVRDNNEREKTADLFTTYKTWCDQNGVRNYLNAIALKHQMERLEYRYVRSNGSWYEGLKLV